MPSSLTTHHSICRFCHAACAILVEVKDGVPRTVKGDPQNPVYRGYTCSRGRDLPAQHTHPDRLLHTQKRQADGSFESISSEQAMDEVAARVQQIVEKHGPRSVAIYIGTSSNQYVAAAASGVGWLIANGSRMVFAASTIDQPGKHIANALHGRWLGGGYMYDEADTWMLIGTNPEVSMVATVSCANPARSMTEARKRGQKLIVVDPRKSEATRHADIHLQSRPGEDPTLLAGLIHVIIRDELYDKDFVASNTQGFERLADAVREFTPGYAAQRSGVDEDDLIAAAKMFAGGTKAAAAAGTGPNMSPRGNLTEYLILCLNTLCGNWRREGEALPNPGVLMSPAKANAQAMSPRKGWGFGEKLRVRDLGNSAAGLPTAALAEEILLEGKGQIRALVCIGGNPVVAWPDQKLTLEALEKLELCVTLDIKMSATAKLSDYVIAPKLSLEVPGTTYQVEAPEQMWPGIGYSRAYGQYTPALIDPPNGSDVIEEWEFFYGLAKRQQLPLSLYPIRAEAGPLRAANKPLALDMGTKPTTEELLDLMFAGTRIPLSALREQQGGAVFDNGETLVAAKEPGWDGKLELAEPTMLGELVDVREEDDKQARDDFPFRLISRRSRGVYNSAGRDLPNFSRKNTYNPSFMNPDDLQALNIEAGSVIQIESERGMIIGIAAEEKGLRRGVVSMAHAFGDAPERDKDYREIGSTTGRLIDNRTEFDPYSGIPRMSSIAVRIQKARDGTGSIENAPRESPR
jgi:anaerobic selenocysteine-containing dehydrogenase